MPKPTKTDDISLPLVIVNPRSAAGSTSEKWTKLASDLRAHFGSYNVDFTRFAGHAVTLAEEGAKAGRQFIIACGGDGTINEVANGILRSGVDSELGVLPSGTGGDFRRTLGLPRNSRDASECLKNGITKKIDVGKVTFTNSEGVETSRYFLNVSSVGLAADVIKRVKSGDSLDWLPLEGVRGKVNYAVSAFKEVIDVEPEMIRISIDGEEERSLQTIAFCIANARFFGGGMKIAPEASVTDGFLDVVNIGGISPGKIITNALSFYRGTHSSLKEVKVTQAKRIAIHATDPSHTILLETDGELPGKLPAVYEVVPQALRVRVPA
ncbi:MAG: diacylglycerol kinase family lipid kinase [Acidobacteria bacterium]|nr:diacylglycerol kinase family lipid kinase [Acidobacteriota bacterium]